MISFSCPECDTELEVPDRAAGTKVTCPDCGERFLVPSRSRTASAERGRESRSASAGRSGKRDGRSTRKEKEGGISTGVSVGLVGGGVALCVVFAVGAYLLLGDKKKSTVEDQPVVRNFNLPPPPPPPVVVEKKPAPVVPLEPALPIITSGAPSGKDVYRHVLKSVAWIL